MEILEQLPLDLQNYVLLYIPSYFIQVTDILMNTLRRSRRRFRFLGIAQGKVERGSLDHPTLPKGEYRFQCRYGWTSTFYFEKTIYFGPLDSMLCLRNILYDATTTSSFHDFFHDSISIPLYPRTYVHEGPIQMKFNRSSS